MRSWRRPGGGSSSRAEFNTVLGIGAHGIADVAADGEAGPAPAAVGQWGVASGFPTVVLARLAIAGLLYDQRPAFFVQEFQPGEQFVLQGPVGGQAGREIGLVQVRSWPPLAWRARRGCRVVGDGGGSREGGAPRPQVAGVVICAQHRANFGIARVSVEITPGVDNGRMSS